MSAHDVTGQRPPTAAILDAFRARLATLQSIRQWAVDDRVRLRDVEFLAEQAFQDFRHKLDKVPLDSEPATARFDGASSSFTRLAAALDEAEREVRQREAPGRWWRLGGTILPAISVGRVVTTLIVAGLVAIAIQRLLPAMLYPNHATRMTDFLRLEDALRRYHSDTGHYPVSRYLEGQDWIGIGWGDAGENWIPELVPKYLSRLPRDPRDTTIKYAQYIYRSDGRDFKLIVLNPEDCVVTTFFRPWLGDTARNQEVCTAYGVWTTEAASW